MTTNEERAEARDAAAIKRDDAAIDRDDAAITRHKELRSDIEETQGMVSQGNDAIFRVDGLQDAFFEHLITATNAIEDATKALDREKKIRTRQVRTLAVAVVLGIIVGAFSLFNAHQINEQSEANCAALNENRDTIYGILERLAMRNGPITPENAALLEDLRATTLRPLECEDNIFSFTPF